MPCRLSRPRSTCVFFPKQLGSDLDQGDPFPPLPWQFARVVEFGSLSVGTTLRHFTLLLPSIDLKTNYRTQGLMDKVLNPPLVCEDLSPRDAILGTPDLLAQGSLVCVR